MPQIENNLYIKYNASDVERDIVCNDIYIYGAGQTAKIFYSQLKERRLTNRIKGIVVSKKEIDSFYGVPVFSLDDIKDNGRLICIAIHERGISDILTSLNNLGLRFVWVYPLVMKWNVGVWIKDVEWKPRRLIYQLQESYVMAIFFLFIRGTLDGNTMLRDIYKKLYLNGITMEMTSKRMDAFTDKIFEWSNKSEYDDTAVVLNKNENVLFDGRHRLSMAAYFDFPQIKCSVHSGDVELFKQRYAFGFPSKAMLRDILNSHEYEMVMKVSDMIKSRTLWDSVDKGYI